MRRILLKFGEERLFRCAHNIVDLIYLIEFIISWEQWIQSNNFKQHATHAPQVHLVSIITVG
mgnify:CR=1 FL=1